MMRRKIGDTMQRVRITSSICSLSKRFEGVPCGVVLLGYANAPEGPLWASPGRLSVLCGTRVVTGLICSVPFEIGVA
jgi:hypothetical protein